MFNPNIFTVVLSHPEAKTVAVTGVGARQLFGVILNASPVLTAVIIPAEVGDENRRPDEVVDRAQRCVYAERPVEEAGFTAHFMSTDGEDEPTWARRVIEGIDASARANRIVAREARMAEARKRYLAHEAVVADRMRHSDSSPLFTLEQRAKLVGA